MGPEMTKLAGMLHARCPYCGIKHAGKHNHTEKKEANFADEHGLYNPPPKKPKQPEAPKGSEHPQKMHGPEIKKLAGMLQKQAFLPALLAAAPAVGSAIAGMAGRAGLMAGGRALLGGAARMAANPIGNMAMQTAGTMGAQKLMQPRQPAQGALPGQIGGM